MKKLTYTAWHQLSADEVVQFFNVALSTGLTPEEVRSRQRESGPPSPIQV